MSEAGVTVVIPTWNRRGLLTMLLDRLALQTLAPAAVVVVDNGSTDGSAEEAERRGARVIRMGMNAGFSRAVNRGIQAADTEWIAVVNNDVEPSPDWLERLVEAAGRRRAWFATGKVLDAGVRNRIDGTYDLLCRGACAWRAGHGRTDGAEFDHECAIAMAPATAALYRAELFRRAGEFDERFESYLEDVDFGLRAALAGCPGVYVPDSSGLAPGKRHAGALERGGSPADLPQPGAAGGKALSRQPDATVGVAAGVGAGALGTVSGQKRRAESLLER